MATWTAIICKSHSDTPRAVSEQFQSSFRAVSEHFQSIFRAIPEPPNTGIGHTSPPSPPKRPFQWETQQSQLSTRQDQQEENDNPSNEIIETRRNIFNLTKSSKSTIKWERKREREGRKKLEAGKERKERDKSKPSSLEWRRRWRPLSTLNGNVKYGKKATLNKKKNKKKKQKKKKWQKSHKTRKNYSGTLPLLFTCHSTPAARNWFKWFKWFNFNFSKFWSNSTCL